MRKLLYTVLGTLLCLNSYSQSLEKGKMYLGAQMGSFGFGAQYGYVLNDRWELRATAALFKKSLETTSSQANYEEKVTRTVDLFGAAVIADYKIFANKPGFRFSTGIFYQGSKITALSSYTGDLNGETIDGGTLELKFSAFPVNPYAGIKLGNFGTEKSWFFAFELGTTYHGHPNVEFNGTGLVEKTARQRDIVWHNVNNYNWFPYANFQLNFLLNNK